MHDSQAILSAAEIARRVVEDGVAPAAAAGCALRLDSSWSAESGGQDDVLFDLASVTKPLTAVAFARTAVGPDTPLGHLLPEARGTPSEHVPVELFLAHRAGLEGHVALYSPLLKRQPLNVGAALHRAASSRRQDAGGSPPHEGFAPVYSDLGYILAGAALARVAGARDAGEAIEALVLGPLGVTGELGTVRELQARAITGPFAQTEDVPWRGGPIVGAVHDENAWAMTGFGGSGHAGLFARVGAILKFGCSVLDALEGSGPFGQTDLRWLTRPRPGGTLRAGFDGKSVEGSSAGAGLGPHSFGHLGFVGTSLWMDPDARVVVTLLTNRIAYSRDNVAIRAARPWAHDALWTRARNMR